MSAKKKTLALIGGGALLLALGSTSGAVAGSLVTSAQIKDNSVAKADIRANAIGQSELADGAVNWPALTGGTKSKIAAADKLGGLAAALQTTPQTIVDLGGSFGKFTATVRATELGELTLEPGQYLVSATGNFDRLVDAEAAATTVLQLALRVNDGSDWGLDYGTCFTGLYPAPGNIEQSCSTTKVVTVEETSTVQVFGFGYNTNQSAAGSGNYTARVDVSAVKVG